jgi:hypothetical protein
VLAALQERISFNPHPKTLTMAGDYEYFAAQGYHPLAFALAELVDNSLRATKGNRECPRSITVSLITDDNGSTGVVCVSDNGSGMNTQDLNNWAVMNLSMEDRGLLNTDEAKGRSTTGACSGPCSSGPGLSAVRIMYTMSVQATAADQQQRRQC